MAEETEKQWADWLDYKNITAPYDGVITLRNIATGDFLQPTNSGSTSKTADPLYVMMRTDIVRCALDVPEIDAPLVKNGEEAEIHFQAMPGAPTIGKVERNSVALGSAFAHFAGRGLSKKSRWQAQTQHVRQRHYQGQGTQCLVAPREHCA